MNNPTDFLFRDDGLTKGITKIHHLKIQVVFILT